MEAREKKEEMEESSERASIQGKVGGDVNYIDLSNHLSIFLLQYYHI